MGCGARFAITLAAIVALLAWRRSPSDPLGPPPVWLNPSERGWQ